MRIFLGQKEAHEKKKTPEQGHETQSVTKSPKHASRMKKEKNTEKEKRANLNQIPCNKNISP